MKKAVALMTAAVMAATIISPCVTFAGEPDERLSSTADEVQMLSDETQMLSDEAQIMADEAQMLPDKSQLMSDEARADFDETEIEGVVC